jgi:hypothetical protein
MSQGWTLKPELYTSTYERLRREPAWSLLTAHLAPQVLALLQHLLYTGDRVLPSSVLHERLATELHELRLQGREITGAASYYISTWLREGWLERRLPEGAEEEEFELSTAAHQALRVIETLQSTRQVATESRLSLVIDQLTQLASDSDANPESRLERLLEERRRIDAEIDAVAAGKIRTIPLARALEQARDIIALAVELTEDFRSVRDAFSKLNREFRERIIQDEGQRGELLNELFSGVDVISLSGPGQSFDAFWRLLTDPEESAKLEDAIAEVMSRDFAQHLTRKERTTLRRLTNTLLERAGSVNNTRTGFARSLRNFVQSKEYREQRRLSRLLRDAKASALEAANLLRPTQQTGAVLRLSSATYRSIGRYKLHDPTLAMQPMTVIEAQTGDVDLLEVAEAIARAEIDFRALDQNLRAALEGQTQQSIGDVLLRFPATQGLGTVVGYLSIGMKIGVLAPDHEEAVSWDLDDGTTRHARIPLIYFFHESFDERDE